MKTKIFCLVVFMLMVAGCNGQTGSGIEPFLIYEEGKTIKTRINPPAGFERVDVSEGSFAHFLRNVKVLPHGEPVKFYNGELKYTQQLHVAVLNYDIGNRDLQQCSDAVIRLHAEYLFQAGRYKDIAYNFISDGKPRFFLEHSANSTDYNRFRKYLDYVYSYGNTRSLYHQLVKVDNFKDMQPGDVLIQTGVPYGHAVIVLDMAINKSTGEKLYIVAQSYMPAQSIHILINPKNKGISPWYSLDGAGDIRTPEWTFKKEDLRRFK